MWIEIGQMIAHRRKMKGWAMADLGDKIGTSRQEINAIEKGKKAVSVERLQKIANALDCRLDIRLTRIN